MYNFSFFYLLNWDEVEYDLVPVHDLGFYTDSEKGWEKRKDEFILNMF